MSSRGRPPDEKVTGSGGSQRRRYENIPHPPVPRQDEVTTTFPFLEAVKVGETMRSACQERLQRLQEANSTGEWCPFLEFAAHTFSASLVQVYLRDVIRRIRSVRDKLKKINLESTPANRSVPEPLGNKDVSTQFEDISSVKTAIVDFNGWLDTHSASKKQRRDEDEKEKKYFHLLRVNQKIKRLWHSQENGRKSQQGEESTTPVENPDKQTTDCSLVPAMESIQRALIHFQSTTPDEAQTQAQEKEAFYTLAAATVQHLTPLLEELCAIDARLKQMHESAYVEQFSPTSFPTDDPAKIHSEFGKRASYISDETRMWNL